MTYVAEIYQPVPGFPAPLFYPLRGTESTRLYANPAREKAILSSPCGTQDDWFISSNWLFINNLPATIYFPENRRFYYSDFVQ